MKKGASRSMPCMGCGVKTEIDADHPKGYGIVCEKCHEPDWNGQCCVCEQSPIVPITGMCGPCTWGEAETAGGNW